MSEINGAELLGALIELRKLVVEPHPQSMDGYVVLSGERLTWVIREIVDPAIARGRRALATAAPSA